VFKGNALTGIAIGLGAFLLVPTLGQVLRPAAKALIKGGILAYQGAYQGLAEIGETASDLVAEARAELEQQGETEILPTSPPARPRSRASTR
jgi:Protein of unknown function (DUF5132)